MDEKGFLEVIDALIAILIIFSVFLLFNNLITIPQADISKNSYEFKQASDVMEQLSSKINVSDKSFLGDISGILKENKDSKSSIHKVGGMVKKRLHILGIDKNYYFSESNHLDNVEIASNGDFKHAQNYTVASRSFGDYCYTLYLF